jgi:Zn-dependent M28 family amino/carboxypeptidase
MLFLSRLLPILPSVQACSAINIDFGWNSSVQLFNDLNCSVSTGFGATDDGMGVITVLQLIRFFTTPGNEPKKGIVAMLNNGEEDSLNGNSSPNLISFNI